jgi:hypothetical protein
MSTYPLGSFHYDNTRASVAPATVSIGSFTLDNSISVAAVSGVTVVGGAPVYDVTVSASDMQGLFYKTPLLTYTPIVGGANQTSVSEPTLANVTTGLANDALANPIVVSRGLNSKPVLTGEVPIAYATSLNLSVKASNFVGDSTVVTGTAINAIVDPKSATLVTTLTTANPPAPSGVVGKQYVSGNSSDFTFLSSLTPTHYLPAPSGASVAYDHKFSIAGSEANYNAELQIHDGKFCATGTLAAYKNYTTYYYSSTLLNGVNYTSLSAGYAYRFATFGWSVPKSAGYTTLNIVLNGASSCTIPTGVGADTFIKEGANPLLIFYRFYDPSPTAGAWANVSSSWISDSQIPRDERVPTASGNYQYTDRMTYALSIASSSYVSPTLTLGSVMNPGLSLQNAPANVMLFVRVGVQKNSTFTFSSVSASYT